MRRPYCQQEPHHRNRTTQYCIKLGSTPSETPRARIAVLGPPFLFERFYSDWRMASTIWMCR